MNLIVKGLSTVAGQTLLSKGLTQVIYLLFVAQLISCITVLRKGYSNLMCRVKPRNWYVVEQVRTVWKIIERGMPTG